MEKNHEYHRPDLEAEDTEASTKAIKRDLSRILKTDSIILDVGANRGQFALEILEIIPTVKIYSFEPVKEAYIDLHNLASQHKQIVAVESAVSTSSGKKTFYVTESDVGSSLLEPLPNQPSKWLTLNKKVTVDSVRLDEFIDKEQINLSQNPISLLKTDTQGTDLDAIVSAGKYLNPKTISSILVEINFRVFYADQIPYYKIFSELDDKGYRLGWLYPHRSHDEWLWWGDALFIPK